MYVLYNHKQIPLKTFTNMIVGNAEIRHLPEYDLFT